MQFFAALNIERPPIWLSFMPDFFFLHVTNISHKLLKYTRNNLCDGQKNDIFHPWAHCAKLSEFIIGALNNLTTSNSTWDMDIIKLWHIGQT